MNKEHVERLPLGGGSIDHVLAFGPPDVGGRYTGLDEDRRRLRLIWLHAILIDALLALGKATAA